MVSGIYERILNGPAWIVAEVGSNHNGDLSTALALIDAAAAAGADAVKFQSFLADDLVLPSNDDYALLRRLEMPEAWYEVLTIHAKRRGLAWFSTVSNRTTLKWMATRGVELYKIGSPTITHLPLIAEAAALGKPLIISTGMGTYGDIEAAIHTALDAGAPVCVLHCVSEYPASGGALWGLTRLRELVAPLPVGYSDHTLGIGTAIAAVALGARMVEKHFTLDSAQEGPDHAHAAEPAEFRAMVEGIRQAEASMAYPTPSPLRMASLRSLHAADDLVMGDVIGESDIAVLRPNDGLAPAHLPAIIGMHVRRVIRKGEPVTWEHFK